MSRTITDFYFNGSYLSDFDSIVVLFSSTGGMTTVDGANISYQTTKSLSTQRFKKTSFGYDNVFQSVIQIGKKICDSQNDKYYSQNEVSKILKWLNTETYRKFKINSDDFYDIYFMGYFNVSKILYNNRCVGFELTFTSDSSFGYKESKITSTITNDKKFYTFQYDNDRESFLFPTFNITIQENGDLELCTDTEPARKTILKDCNIGDVIILDCENRIIQSSNSLHHLAGSFNFVFPRINYNFKKKTYSININLNCDIVMDTTLVRKIGMI